MSQTVAPQDQFILIIVGHGSFSDTQPGLVLQGPDLDPATLAKPLAAIKADNQVILNLAGGGGNFLKPLAKKGRVNIAATGPDQAAEPVFAEFFLRALEGNRADGEGTGTKDNQTSLLEAFNWAAHQTAQFIMRQVGTEDGAWTLHGKESVEIFRKLYDAPPGAESTAPAPPVSNDGSRRLSPDSDASKPDQPVPLVLPQDLKPNAAAEWNKRRITNEQAHLEDAGLEEGVTPLRGEKGYDPIPVGKEGEPGNRAARTLLGRPELLPVK
jgi:hypothetical protein